MTTPSILKPATKADLIRLLLTLQRMVINLQLNAIKEKQGKADPDELYQHLETVHRDLDKLLKEVQTEGEK